MTIIKRSKIISHKTSSDFSKKKRNLCIKITIQKILTRKNTMLRPRNPKAVNKQHFKVSLQPFTIKKIILISIEYKIKILEITAIAKK